jgi:anti-anti-sigma factor
LRPNGSEGKKKDFEKHDTLERLASIGQVSAGIAHEVRNPLTSVKGFLQLLKEESPHPYLDVANSELDRAISILQDLLQVSKPDLDEENYMSINLCTELEALLFLFQDKIYRVQVETKFRDTNELVFGKKNQLKKALFNLLKNAFEAIKDEGVITIEHYRYIDSIYLCISDTGIGIPAEKLHLLGTPFYSTKDEGTGMGLAQVFSTVYQHGARIEVNSKEGIGTTFVIEFPIKTNQKNGVKNLNLQYLEDQSFKEFFMLNEGRFKELLNSQVETILEQAKLNGKNHLLEITELLMDLLEEEKQHELIMLAKDRGNGWAKGDLPLILKLEWTQAFRQMYWDFLHSYYKRVELNKEDFFELERKINMMLDQYIHHFCSSYAEYKNEVLRSHRELIEDLTVPVIPLSKTMAVLPVVGSVDTFRAKKIQERLLKQIETLQVRRIIIDLSGVAYMDTAVIGHLFRIVEGVNILGCKAVITGIRSEIANTIVELGAVMTEKVETKGTLQQALEDYGVNEYQRQD